MRAAFFFPQALAGIVFSKSPTPPPSQELNGRPLKVMLHRTIRNDDFKRNATLQHSNIRAIYTRKNKTRLTFCINGTFRLK